MIVDLAKGQYQVCLDVAPGTNTRTALMREAYAMVGPRAVSTWTLAIEGGRWPGKKVRVRAPYIAWLSVQAALMTRSLTSSGRFSPEVPARQINAMKSVQRGINTMDRHPALTGQAIVGRSGEIIPAWRHEERWVPYPNGGEFRLLTPELIERDRLQVTRWLPAEPGPHSDWICQEATHLGLWAESPLAAWDPHIDPGSPDE